jgi:uncharacterized protein (TIGR02246 family)
MIRNAMSMPLRSILVLLLLLDGGACLAKHATTKAPLATDPAAARRAVESANQDFIVALKKADLKAMADAFEPTAILLTPGADMQRGRDEIAKFLAGLLAHATIVEASSVTIDVTLSGDSALETGLYTLTTRSGDAPAVADRGKYLVVWHHDDAGHWRILRGISNASSASRP